MVGEFHLITADPLYHHTWFCLHNYNYQEALFTAERIFAENPNEEAIYLLATCFYRCNGPKQAKNFILRQETTTSAKCRFLLARCFMDIGDLAEAENSLLGVRQELDSPSEVALFYKDIAPFVLKMLGEIFKQSERRKLAIAYLRKCLELNPLFWMAYTELVDLHDNIDPAEVFSLPKNVVLDNQSCLRALSNKINIGDVSHPHCPSKKRTDIHDSQEDLSVSRENVNPKFEEKFMDSVSSNDFIHISDDHLSYSFNGSDQHINSNSTTEHICNNQPSEINDVQTNIQSQKIQVSKTLKKDFEDMEIEQIKPLFGNAYLEQSPVTYSFVPVFNCKSAEPVDNILTQSPIKSQIASQILTINSKKNRGITAKRVSFSNLKTHEYSTPYANARTDKISTTISSPFPNPTNKHDLLNYSVIQAVPMSPLCHESGKGNDSHSFVQSGNLGLFEVPGPRTRSQAKALAAQKSSYQKEYIQLSDDSYHNKSSTESDTRLQSAIYYLQLLIGMGKAYKYMKNFKLHDAIAHIKQLPRHHYETSLLSSWLAKLYLEMNNKIKACSILTLSCQNEPWQLHCVVQLSATLWVLNKEKELSNLAKDMTEMDRECVEVWCVYGNCMSLNKETEVATRFFQRVIQLNPNYANGYLLLGHEYFNQDKLDAALTTFRKALDMDTHDYRASYYIASVFQRQDNFIEAEKTLKEALKIFPESYVLLTNLGVVRSKLKQHFAPDASLELLEKVCRLYPNEPLCRFHKANTLFHCGRYLEALEDLKVLENIKEARIYLLMSVIYKQIGNLTKAMVYNTWAIELDPKCSNDSFMIDRNLCNNNNNSGGGVTANISTAEETDNFPYYTSLTDSRSYSESSSMHDDSMIATSASNNQTNFNLPETD